MSDITDSTEKAEEYKKVSDTCNIHSKLGANGLDECAGDSCKAYRNWYKSQERDAKGKSAVTKVRVGRSHAHHAHHIVQMRNEIPNMFADTYPSPL